MAKESNKETWYLLVKGRNAYKKLEAPRSLYSSPGYNNNISQ